MGLPSACTRSTCSERSVCWHLVCGAWTGQFMQLVYLFAPFVLFRSSPRSAPQRSADNGIWSTDPTSCTGATTPRDIATVRRGAGGAAGGADFRPGVVFDANAGWKLEGRYRDDAAFCAAAGPAREACAGGAQGAARRPSISEPPRGIWGRGSSATTALRDWAETHPEVRAPGKLIRGGYRHGKLWLELD